MPVGGANGRSLLPMGKARFSFGYYGARWELSVCVYIGSLWLYLPSPDTASDGKRRQQRDAASVILSAMP